MPGRRSVLAAPRDVRYSAPMPPPDDLHPPRTPPVLIPFATALERIARNAAPLGTECVTLAQAGGRILAVPVRATIDSPRRDAAAMDGFALGEQHGDESRWQVIEQGAAGDATLVPGTAMRVATGAPMPAGAMRVLPIEQTDRIADWISILGEPGGRTHVRLRGSDFRRGDITLAAGRRIDPRALVAIAAADVAAVSVMRAPRVAVVVLGEGQVAPGMAATSDQAVPDSLGEALRLFAAGWGGRPVDSVRVGDDPAALAAAVVAERGRVDVIVLVGGAAHGARTATQRTLAPLGLELGFDGLAVRPGRPSWYGTIGATHLLGLPGNPTAAMTLARLLLAPLLVALGGGDAKTALAWEDLPLAAPAAATGARESFLCAMAEDGAVRLLDRADVSGQLMLAAADRLVSRPAHGPALAAGTRVPTLRF